MIIKYINNQYTQNYDDDFHFIRSIYIIYKIIFFDSRFIYENNRFVLY